MKSSSPAARWIQKERSLLGGVEVLFVALAVLVSLVASALVAIYVAYPHRGQAVPVLPWLGDAMAKAVGAAPVLDDDERDLIRLR